MRSWNRALADVVGAELFAGHREGLDTLLLNIIIDQDALIRQDYVNIVREIGQVCGDWTLPRWQAWKRQAYLPLRFLCESVSHNFKRDFERNLSEKSLKMEDLQGAF